jgi:hypothetical protein
MAINVRHKVIPDDLVAMQHVDRFLAPCCLKLDTINMGEETQKNVSVLLKRCRCQTEGFKKALSWSQRKFG